jgi:peptide deformylase
MATRPILTVPNPFLRLHCDVVTEFGPELAALAEDMFETMYAAPGRGLAASQLGILERIFVMDSTWKQGQRSPKVFVNPQILESSEDHKTLEEGCLSMPDQIVKVTRPARVKLRWQDLNGNEQSGWFEGFEAACVQHERDHLDGILCSDYAGKT